MPANNSIFQPLPVEAFMGPYKGYLEPATPTITSEHLASMPLGGASAYAAGLASFLEGATKGRVRAFEQKENEKLQKISMLNSFVNQIANRQDLTNDIKEQIATEAHHALSQEFLAASGKGPKDPSTPHGFVHGLLHGMATAATAATGGPAPKGSPDVTGVMARLYNTAFDSSGKPLPQYHLPTQINNVMQQAQADLSKLGPGAWAQDADKILQPYAVKLMELAGPNAANYISILRSPFQPKPEPGSPAWKNIEAAETVKKAGPGGMFIVPQTPAPVQSTAPTAGQPGPPTPMSPVPVANYTPAGPGYSPAGPPASQPSDPNSIRAMAAAAARAEGVPEDFYLRIINTENSRPGQISPKGAIGPAQLMPGTAHDLRVNPYDTAQNLQGGARYAGQMLRMFHGDQTLAAAAYNAGPGAVQRYGGVPPYAETQAYVKNFTPAGSAAAPPAPVGTTPAAGPVQTPGPPPAQEGAFNWELHRAFETLGKAGTGATHNIEYTDMNGNKRTATATQVQNPHFSGWVDVQTNQPIRSQGDVRITTGQPQRERYALKENWPINGKPHNVRVDLDTGKVVDDYGETGLTESQQALALAKRQASFDSKVFATQNRYDEALRKIQAQYAAMTNKDALDAFTSEPAKQAAIARADKWVKDQTEMAQRNYDSIMGTVHKQMGYEYYPLRPEDKAIPKAEPTAVDRYFH